MREGPDGFLSVDYAGLLAPVIEALRELDDRLTEAIYGDGVYAQSLLGSAASVAALEREEVLAFYRRHYALCGSAHLPSA